jgi:aminoglycoside 3-N-acetyltransferase
MATMRLSRPVVTGEQIAECLGGLGVREGDALIFHSALSSVGMLIGGQEALIDSMLAAVGQKGTVMVPVMPDMAVPFDPQHSPSTVGSVSEFFRRRADAKRSLHPTHSVAAIGAAAEVLVEGHENCTPCGVGSPFEKLARMGGWVLLFGVDQDRNTSLHTAEDLADVPYLRQVEVPVVGRDGQVCMVTVPKYPLGHREFIGIDKRLRQAGIVRLGRAGNAVLRLMPARGMLEFSLALLRADPAAFLCRKPRCVSCRWAEARIRDARGGEADATDWAAVSRRWGCRDTRCEVCYV